MNYEEMTRQHYKDLLIGAEDWAIDQVIDTVTRLEDEVERWKNLHQNVSDERAGSFCRLQKALGGCILTPYQPEVDLEIEAAIKALRKIEANVKELGLSEWYVTIRHADKGKVLLKGWSNEHFPALLDLTIKKINEG